MPCPTEAKEFTFQSIVTLLIYAALEGWLQEMTKRLLSRCKTRPKFSDLATPFLFLAIKDLAHRQSVS